METVLDRVYNQFVTLFAEYPYITLQKLESYPRIFIKYGNLILFVVHLDCWQGEFIVDITSQIDGNLTQVHKSFTLTGPEFKVDDVAKYIQNFSIFTALQAMYKEFLALQGSLSKLNAALPTGLQCQDVNKVCDVLIGHFQSLPGAPDYEKAKDRFEHSRKC